MEFFVAYIDSHHISDRKIALKVLNCKLNFKSLKNSWKISKFFLILLMLRWRTAKDSESLLLTNVLGSFTVKCFVSKEEILSKNNTFLVVNSYFCMPIWPQLFAVASQTTRLNICGWDLTLWCSDIFKVDVVKIWFLGRRGEVLIFYFYNISKKYKILKIKHVLSIRKSWDSIAICLFSIARAFSLFSDSFSQYSLFYHFPVALTV